MKPMTNTGVGGTTGMPDPCLTATPTGPVPMPYPNMGLTAQSFPFSFIVMVCKRAALNMMSKIMTSMGMEPGAVHPLYKQFVSFMLGHPTVFVDKAPTITLGSVTAGNGMNNALGAVSIPSVVNVTAGFTRSAAEVPAVGEALPVRMSSEGVAVVELSLFTQDTRSRLHRALSQLTGAQTVVLDLRGNPGGDVHAMVGAAGTLLPDGSPVVTLVDSDGDAQVYRARGAAPFTVPLVVWVDEETASAAELFAGALQVHGRALVVGARTFGKSAVSGTIEGRALLPDGRDIAGQGVAPDAPQPRWTSRPLM